MSLHPPPPPDHHHHQHTAPFPNMMDTTLAAATPAKRGPEDDIQFVAAHPVKKPRDGREQHPPPPVGQQQPIPARGNSLPAMDNFTFPSLNGEVPSQTSQSSPLLSPKQLPPVEMPNHTHATTETPTTGSTTATSSTCGPISPTQPTMPWQQMPGLPSNFVLPTQSPSSSQPAAFVPFPPPNPGPTTAGEVGETEPQQSQSPHDASQQPEQPPAHTILPSSSPSEAQSGLQSSAPTTKEAGLEAYSHEAIDGAANAQLSHSPPPKPPCLACEQSHQHAIFNPANAHLTGYQPKSPYPWYVPGATQQHMHMGAGFNMAANGSHPRAYPTPASHAPMGYNIFPPQVQSQMPIALARPFNSTAMSGQESLQSILLQNQGQQVPPGQQLSHLSSTYPQQISQPQYMQSQLHPYPQPLVIPRSFMAPTQAAAAPAQPSPRPSTSRAPTPPEPREYSPNLIVDIAETCEDLFPWEEVAQRHNVSRQKVVETFSAVVQLPLLRCTTDKRRHGNLATSRLRQYTKAKRDVEKASSTTSPPSPTSPPAPSSNQPQGHGDRAVLPLVWEMANTMAPLSLPPSIANSLAGAWQR